LTAADDAFDRWLVAAEERYLADLTRAELGRALRALASCYVQRRDRLGKGHALEGRGKRAAFALYYAPLHYLTVREIARAMGDAGLKPRGTIIDVGCGTGAAGAAWASVTGGEVRGSDVSAWAVQEAAWTYRTLGVRGEARRAGVEDLRLPARPAFIIAAFVINELEATSRAAALHTLCAAAEAGHQLVVVEPIAKGLTPWWREWTAALAPMGAEAREWRFRVDLPPLLRDLDRSAGMDHRELTARTLSLHNS
jgi:hypothetical protein